MKKAKLLRTCAPISEFPFNISTMACTCAGPARGTNSRRASGGIRRLLSTFPTTPGIQSLETRTNCKCAKFGGYVGIFQIREITAVRGRQPITRGQKFFNNPYPIVTKVT